MRLTPLVGASQARGCIRRASAQHRLRGAKQERSTYRVRHVTKAAYIEFICSFMYSYCDLSLDSKGGISINASCLKESNLASAFMKTR